MAPRRQKKVVESSESSDAEVADQNDVPSEMDDVPPSGPATSKPSMSRSRPDHLKQQARPVSSPKGKKRRTSTVFTDASNGNRHGGEQAQSSSPSRPGVIPQQKSFQHSVSSFVEQDDRMERRKRRKSTRVSFAPPSSDAEGEVEGSGKQDANDERGNGDSGEVSRVPTTRRPRMSASRINAVAPAPVVSIDVMNSNFEEWMKMATDNVSFSIAFTRFSCVCA